MNNDLEQFSEERLKKISSSAFYYAGCEINEIQALARIALSALQAKPIGEIRLSEYRSDGTREASVACLHDQADWDNFTDGTLLYLNPQPAQTEQGEMPDKALSLSETIGELRKYIDSSGGYNFEALRSEQVNYPAIPDGWKLVPEEATLAMLTLLGMTGSFEFMQQKYKNMLRAAPKPESE